MCACKQCLTDVLTIWQYWGYHDAEPACSYFHSMGSRLLLQSLYDIRLGRKQMQNPRRLTFCLFKLMQSIFIASHAVGHMHANITRVNANLILTLASKQSQASKCNNTSPCMPRVCTTQININTREMTHQVMMQSMPHLPHAAPPTYICTCSECQL